jgi:hypothetical protein
MFTSNDKWAYSEAMLTAIFKDASVGRPHIDNCVTTSPEATPYQITAVVTLNQPQLDLLQGQGYLEENGVSTTIDSTQEPRTDHNDGTPPVHQLSDSAQVSLYWLDFNLFSVTMTPDTLYEVSTSPVPKAP